MNSSLKVVSGGATLAAEIVGSGPAVVFLHANVCDKRMWRPQLDAVGAHCRAIAYDRRGFGGTASAAEDYSAVADLVAVLDATVGAAPAILVGCSQGANIALGASLMHPSRVRGLVLIAPTVAGASEAVYSSDLAEMVAQQKRAEAAGDLDRLNDIKARLFLDGPLAPEGRVEGDARRLFLDMNAIALRAAPGGVNPDNWPIFSRLDEIAVPSLVIWGTLDFPHIQERGRAVAAMLPDAQGKELPGTAHLPSLEQPEAVTGWILDLVRRCL
ncbi:alpha/beta fold hydrolase [Achromobacter agilis]|uniref:2-hydroxy-6-oxononadienedioate/2-hydroxy-6-oxononatrienedioate hydrolase n=1 Tax=Achromobacter agilis TaxID=1353888 RepID=A0A446CE08_9BURK|nr:alpha/beta fold hydrolase [Achromobacter agilis]SSW66053.1 2-hydroxy-6-oxononadienedioate/2-hydroxy-6-oxononatrienedioate hydrolase [Achromobacter agilis]